MQVYSSTEATATVLKLVTLPKMNLVIIVLHDFSSDIPLGPEAQKNRTMFLDRFSSSMLFSSRVRGVDEIQADSSGSCA